MEGRDQTLTIEQPIIRETVELAQSFVAHADRPDAIPAFRRLSAVRLSRVLLIMHSRLMAAGIKL